MTLTTLRVGEKVQIGSPHQKTETQRFYGMSGDIIGTVEAIDAVGVRIVMDDEDQTIRFLPWGAMGACTVLEPNTPKRGMGVARSY